MPSISRRTRYIFAIGLSMSPRHRVVDCSPEDRRMVLTPEPPRMLSPAQRMKKQAGMAVRSLMNSRNRLLRAEPVIALFDTHS